MAVIGFVAGEYLVQFWWSCVGIVGNILISDGRLLNLSAQSTIAALNTSEVFMSGLAEVIANNVSLVSSSIMIVILLHSFPAIFPPVAKFSQSDINFPLVGIPRPGTIDAALQAHARIASGVRGFLFYASTFRRSFVRLLDGGSPKISGRRSCRVICPSVASSMERQCLDGALFHCEMACGEMFKTDASFTVPPAFFMAVSSEFVFMLKNVSPSYFFCN